MVARWVVEHNEHLTIEGPYSAIGMVDASGNLLAGTVYEKYTQRDIHMHIAAVPGRRWMTRQFIGECFRYPFVQLGCVRVTALVPSANKEAIRFNEHAGFVLEGRVRQYLSDREDVLVYGMLRSECRWLRVGVHSGRTSTGGSGRLPDSATV